MIKVSIIVPVYNVEKYLKKCLDSLVNQTLENIEILVINDGSLDKSQLIIDEYLSKYPSIVKAFTKENGGQASARNLGIENALGEYIGFVDSDDWVEQDMYEKLYNFAVNKNLDIVTCYLYKIINNEKIKDEYGKRILQDNIKNYILTESSPVNKIIKRDIFKNNNVRFLENHIYEDLAMIPTLALYTNKIGGINEYLYNYLIRENSTMNQTQYNNKLEDIFAVMDYLYSKFRCTPYKQELEYLYIVHLLHGASLRFLKFKQGKEQIVKISEIMFDKFKDWRKNKYYKKKGIKYKIVCNLFYYKKINLAKLLLKK